MEKGHTARLGASSPWRFGSRPQRACREMAPRGKVEKRRGGTGDGEAGLAGELGAWLATSASSRRLHGVRGKTEEGEGWSEGNFVNRAKFKISFCKLNFSLLSWPQTKNF